jgi:polysaccharide biosynthesis protein PslG
MSREKRWCWLLVCLMLLMGAAPTQGQPRVVAGLPEAIPQRGYGFMIAHPPAHLKYLTDAGFDWFKYYANWEVVAPNRDQVYNWDTVDWLLNDACKHGLHLLLRVGRNSDNWRPIQDSEMDGWELFHRDLAARIVERRATCSKFYVVALEIWNEPNLDFQWNYEPVDPARYTEMVRRAYRGVKAVAPDILVVAGSLAPTGGLPARRAMNDVEFLHAMYAAGLKGHFDAISIHNYGFGRAPEVKNGSDDILNFRRAEDIYATMVAHGDGDKAVWGTEFGWLLASPECNGYWNDIGFGWHQVSASQQADYLVRAFRYAEANWPWMKVLIVSNLEFSVMTWWYGACDPLRYFSVLNVDKSPRPAYTALQQMEKRPLGLQTLGMEVSPPGFMWLMTPAEAQSTSRTVTVHNTGQLPFRWSASVVSNDMPVTLSASEGECGGSFTVTVNPIGLPLGTHTAEIRVTANQASMPGNPHHLPLRMVIADPIYRTQLPMVRR